jgi:replicative superfamily II helicase
MALSGLQLASKLPLSDGTDVDRIDSDALDMLETTMISAMTATPGLEDRAFAPNYTTNTSIANLHQLIKRNADRGSVLVFASDPTMVFELLAQHENLKMRETVPFWNELITINRQFVGQLQKVKTTEYMEALDRIEEFRSRAQKEAIRDTSMSELVNTVQRDIARFYNDRKSKLQSLYTDYREYPSSRYILDQIKLDPDSVSEHYEPYTHLQFGRYASMNIGDVREVYPDMAESQCRTVTDGIGLMDDYCDLPSSIKIIQIFNKRRISVLITGRHRLAVGVNIPAASAIIYDPEDEFEPAEIKQMAERPGRKGIDRRGHATIIRATNP